MKKILSIPALLLLTGLACSLTVPVSPTAAPAETVIPTPTPEIFIALTQAVPGELQPTEAPAPTAGAGTTVTYPPLTFTIPQTVASGASGSDIPRLDGEDAANWQKTPGHLQVSLTDYYLLQGKAQQPAIYVYPAADYAGLTPAAFESIHRLNNFLYAPENVPALDQLPGVPFMNAKMLFAAHIQELTFQNGKGIRCLTQYGQALVPANNSDLFYNFIGLTNDGASYIVAIFPLTNPLLAKTGAADAPLPAGGIPFPDLADPNANPSAYSIAITDLLNAEPPERFTPALGELDRLVQSMLVAP